MNKKRNGFTLTELLVVVAIIAIIAIIAIPSIIIINKRINKRLYNEKVDMIAKAAEVYANENPDAFGSNTEITVYVGDLIKNGYLKEDAKGAAACGTDPKNSKNINEEVNNEIYMDSCIINPIENINMNGDYVVIKREAVGVTTEYNGEKFAKMDLKLLDQVCTKLQEGKIIADDANAYNTANEKGYFIGKKSATEKCDCTDVKTNGTKCLVTGDTKNNYLKYSGVMWRVMGVYNVDGVQYVKIINDDNIEMDIN